MAQRITACRDDGTIRDVVFFRDPADADGYRAAFLAAYADFDIKIEDDDAIAALKAAEDAAWAEFDRRVAAGEISDIPSGCDGHAGWIGGFQVAP